MARTGSYDRTMPGNTPAGRDLDEDVLDFIEMDAAERAELRAWALIHAKRASRQNVADETAQREYLRLVDEFERSREPSFFDAKFFAGVALAVTAGAIVGLIWKAHRKKKAQESTAQKTGTASAMLGLDLLGAS